MGFSERLCGIFERIHALTQTDLKSETSLYAFREFLSGVATPETLTLLCGQKDVFSKCGRVEQSDAGLRVSLRFGDLKQILDGVINAEIERSAEEAGKSEIVSQLELALRVLRPAEDDEKIDFVIENALLAPSPECKNAIY